MICMPMPSFVVPLHGISARWKIDMSALQANCCRMPYQLGRQQVMVVSHRYSKVKQTSFQSYASLLSEFGNAQSYADDPVKE